MYKEYTQIKHMEVMGETYPNSLTKLQKRGSLQGINLIKYKGGKK